jgi:hypothetical protein
VWRNEFGARSRWRRTADEQVTDGRHRDVSPFVVDLRVGNDVDEHSSDDAHLHDGGDFLDRQRRGRPYSRRGGRVAPAPGGFGYARSSGSAKNHSTPPQCGQRTGRPATSNRSPVGPLLIALAPAESALHNFFMCGAPRGSDGAGVRLPFPGSRGNRGIGRRCAQQAGRGTTDRHTQS